MTSPVDTSVKFFHSKMLGAPVLRGQAGSLIAILDACLVNGWGIQTASSCVVAGGVCTMTFPLDHAAMVDAVILVDGASMADLNGEQKVTAIAPNVVKFATAAANGTATGTITAKMAPMGFAKPFSGTNLAVYKSLDVQANGQFCRVNDASGLYARVNGYENMTAVSTGTGIFPTSSQLSGGNYWQKAVVTAGAYPVAWTVYGDSRFFSIYTCPHHAYGPDFVSGFPVSCVGAFGDLDAQCRASDPFATGMLGGNGASSSSAVASYIFSTGLVQTAYLPRALSGLGSSAESQCYAAASLEATDPVFDRVSGSVHFASIALQTLPVLATRAFIPGTNIGKASYMEQVFSPPQVFKAGFPERSYLAQLSGNDISTSYGLVLVALDVTGPIR